MKMPPLDAARIDRQRGEDGFTLIEVLVTLALVAALSMIILAMVSQFRAITMARERNDAIIEVEALAGFVEEAVRDARPFPLIQDGPQRHPMMIGGPDRLAFVAVSRIGSRQYGLRDVSIFLERGADRQNDSRLIQSLRPRRAGEQIQTEAVELARIDELQFRYWTQGDASQAPAGGAWRSEWTQTDRLPASVGITVSITRSGHKVSAERILHLSAVPE
ncbi:prepilin-type N-terminal cleavage/methylation domain-containing protein [Agrobacterium rhizogenes]|nr:prepilin-type N-terminal cleavage/methylation domain-containing protein [Rhizobium rhizogenes]NTG88963.1 prepilin-type N-terminal cleavage/methylation domain-containing protein [Rhizobium rhizogenes]NTH14841.1 prepilin-type N-terminal cleavage/methylation domain-containing protein [Rhizobium rhizogenes]NTH21230.1 prepilin-type N-terminal cleavage/methylation domain-containing protein [Rhizobium rhizogenes]NTH34260.1 prepilin-type N-terminal cleavage/methylation domain-containing protein [Rhi